VAWVDDEMRDPLGGRIDDDVGQRPELVVRAANGVAELESHNGSASLGHSTVIIRLG
jgi:hypothetical protein